DRIREVRNARQLSLTDVAVKAGVSVATLSRIENNKQGLDLDLFMLLARILKTDPNDILDDAQRGAAEPIAQKINALRSTERVRFWKELSAASRDRREGKSHNSDLAGHVDELLAQIDYIRDELLSIRKSVRRPAKRA
ncbi:MAG TPA: helix-turn-helix transcriptional regulator, partial [Thermoanaerobaculia bacterium]|nr:helix-turn-helix transcriptional regulator [Thermoanaerobaculia bacterium]